MIFKKETGKTDILLAKGQKVLQNVSFVIEHLSFETFVVVERW